MSPRPADRCQPGELLHVELVLWSSSRASFTSVRQKLLRDAMQRCSGSHCCPAQEGSSAGAGTVSPPEGFVSPASPPVGTRTTASPLTERPASTQGWMDACPAPAPVPLPALHLELPVEHSPVPDSNATGSPHLTPQTLFSPTTLIVGDSIFQCCVFPVPPLPLSWTNFLSCYNPSHPLYSV